MDPNFRVFDFHRIFIGDTPAAFLLEIVFRTLVMYGYTIILLRILGKRSIGQLSTLELAIIICFGSAVGDPMVGANVPILHGLTAITAVALLQISMERVINRNKKLEAVMEGSPECVVDEGVIQLSHLDKDNLSHADLFRALRAKDVEQLGQVRKAYFETSGQVSVLFQSPKNTRMGLSILPENEALKEDAAMRKNRTTENDAEYSCTQCGYTEFLEAGKDFKTCSVCGCDDWIKAVK